MTNATKPPGREAVARARCRYCAAELSVSAWDAALALRALDELLAMHGWTLDAQGFRVCAGHPPPAAEAA
jgi:hypothetical protein